MLPRPSLGHSRQQHFSLYCRVTLFPWASGRCNGSRSACKVEIDLDMEAVLAGSAVVGGPIETGRGEARSRLWTANPHLPSWHVALQALLGAHASQESVLGGRSGAWLNAKQFREKLHCRSTALVSLVGSLSMNASNAISCSPRC